MTSLDSFRGSANKKFPVSVYHYQRAVEVEDGDAGALHWLARLAGFEGAPNKF